MAQRVGIVATAQTKYEANKRSLDFAELALEVVEKVMEETGLTFADDGSGIDAAVSCSQDFWDGRTISGMNDVDAVGGHHRDHITVANDGAFGALLGFLQILSGHADVVLVVARCYESITEGRLVENSGVEPFYQRLLGLDFLSGAALQANRYMHKYGVTPEQCARVVVKSRANAQKNPYAQAPADVKVEDVLDSRLLAYPIRALDTKPVADGACAIILAREDKARKLAAKPVWIRSIGSCYDSHLLGDRDLADCRALELAAQQAYKMAGIRDPRKEIHVAEISEYYSYQELMWTEGLGLCGKGEGYRLLESGATALGGWLPVNPSGGLLSGVPNVVAGLSRVAEAALQLRGEAGGRQVPGARTALAHGVDGLCGQLHCVLALKRD